jgi:hypothetical protein
MTTHTKQRAIGGHTGTPTTKMPGRRAAAVAAEADTATHAKNVARRAYLHRVARTHEDICMQTTPPLSFKPPGLWPTLFFQTAAGTFVDKARPFFQPSPPSFPRPPERLRACARRGVFPDTPTNPHSCARAPASGFAPSPSLTSVLRSFGAFTLLFSLSQQTSLCSFQLAALPPRLAQTPSSFEVLRAAAYLGRTTLCVLDSDGLMILRRYAFNTNG